MTSEAGPRGDIPKAYDPRAVEERLYRFWEERGHFTPRIDPQGRPFTIIMPPPNLTGELHLGHALEDTITDILIRWHRMQGDPTLWLPGIDHAAIAVHVVVEKELAREGLTRHEMGRERFLERVWDFVNRNRRRIFDQHKRLGASADWTRERFTMDEGSQRAVRTTFRRLYDQGLIYRGERIINWCPRCQTVLSDLEVEHHEQQGHLWYVRYPLLSGDGSPEEGQYITIATTRPETIVADTGIAVHPGDERYEALVGRRALLPIIGRAMPIVADEVIDPAFGTGALKVTPGHDPVDFDIGQRHGLPIVSAIAPDATMNEEAGPYKGMDRDECRRAIVRDLEEQGYLVKTEPYVHSVGHCYRCDSVVEPLVSLQWFMRMEPRRTRPTGHRGGEGRPHPLRAGALREGLPELDGEHPRLVRLAPALVGPSHPRLVLRRLRRARRCPFCLTRAIPWRTRLAVSTAGPAASNRTRTRSTPGSLPPSGLTPRWAGLTTPRTFATSIPPPSCRWGTRSSSSGAPA